MLYSILLLLCVNRVRFPLRWRRCSSNICSRWNPVFSTWTAPCREPILLIIIGHMESLVWLWGKPCKHIMPPSEVSLSSWFSDSPRRLRWRMLLSDRSRCFRRALSSERRYGCLVNANLRGIAAYIQQDPSFPPTDHHHHNRREGRYYYHHCEGKGVTTTFHTM